MTTICRANPVEDKQVIEKSIAFLDELVLYSEQLIHKQDFNAKSKLIDHIERFRDLKPALEHFLLIMETGEERKEIEEILKSSSDTSKMIDDLILWKYKQQELTYYPLVSKFDYLIDLSEELTGLFEKKEDLEDAVHVFVAEDSLLKIKDEVENLKAELDKM